MAVGRTEILSENKKYYSSFYSFTLEKLYYLLISEGYILICGVLALFIKNSIYRSFYNWDASRQSLDGQEVVDFVEKSVKSSRLDNLSMIIIASFVVLAVYVLLINLLWKNYQIYKKRKRISLIPWVLVVLFVVREIWMIRGQIQWVNISSVLKLISFIIDYLPLIATIRTFITLEVRDSKSAVLNGIDIISNELVKKL